MILEEIIGDAKFNITKNGKSVTLKVGDSFTDEEYQTRTVYGDGGKAVIRVDQNSTIEISAAPAPTPVATVATPTPAPASAAKAIATPVMDEIPAE